MKLGKCERGDRVLVELYLTGEDQTLPGGDYRIFLRHETDNFGLIALAPEVKVKLVGRAEDDDR
jgi:hypothetical protein